MDILGIIEPGGEILESPHSKTFVVNPKDFSIIVKDLGDIVYRRAVGSKTVVFNLLTSDRFL